MKKVLLILALVLSANAWAEDMRLACSDTWQQTNYPNTTGFFLTFDKDEGKTADFSKVSNNEENIYGETVIDLPITWTSEKLIMEYYEFIDGERFSGGGHFIDFSVHFPFYYYLKTLEISRSSLEFTENVLRTFRVNGEEKVSKEHGTCEVVEIDTSDRKF